MPDAAQLRGDLVEQRLSPLQLRLPPELKALAVLLGATDVCEPKKIEPVGVVANVASAGISLSQGRYGAAALSLAFAVPIIGQLGAEAHAGLELGEGGYRSFSAFKRAYGAAGEFADWHHIVGQTESNVARFGPGAIHNAENIVAVPRNIHWQINSIYESETFLGSGQSVREWLAPQSFQAQRDYGLGVLQRFGIVP